MLHTGHPAPFPDMLEFPKHYWLYAQRIEARHIARGFDADAEYVRPVCSVSVAYFNRLSQIAAA